MLLFNSKAVLSW